MADPKAPNPFTQLKITRENRKQSIQWFQDQIKLLKRSSYQPKALQQAKNHTVKYLTVGTMVMFEYDPKYAEELPFYDTFPVIFVIDNHVKSVGGEGFYGLNLHYLPPPIRLKLLTALYDIANNDKFNATTKLRITYDVLQRLGSAKNVETGFAFKHYLHSHVKSAGFVQVPSSSWAMTMLLPIEAFKKHTKQFVWHQYRTR